MRCTRTRRFERSRGECEPSVRERHPMSPSSGNRCEAHRLVWQCATWLSITASTCRRVAARCLRPATGGAEARRSARPTGEPHRPGPRAAARTPRRPRRRASASGLEPAGFLAIPRLMLPRFRWRASGPSSRILASVVPAAPADPREGRIGAEEDPSDDANLGPFASRSRASRWARRKLARILLCVTLEVLRWRHVGLAFALAMQLGCTHSPEYIRCHNNASCREQSSDFRYCVRQRCVQCASDSACGSGEKCVDGRCEHR